MTNIFREVLIGDKFALRFYPSDNGWMCGITNEMIDALELANKALDAQRQWVGLTQEEFDKLIDDAGFTRSDLLMIGACVEQIVDLAEKKLKEKNT